MGGPRILPAEHPLAGVSNVGPDAPEDVQSDAAAVLGVAIGDRLRCLFAAGKPAAVVRLNPADLEIGVELHGAGGRVLWCRRDELDAARVPSLRAADPVERAAFTEGCQGVLVLELGA
jgi:hypothetical protein